MPLSDMPALPAQNRTEYVRGMLRLGAFYAWRCAAAGEALRQVLNGKTHIYRLTTLWDGRNVPWQDSFPWRGSPWGAVLDEMERLFERHCRDAQQFEDAALALLWPLAEPAIARDVANWPWIPEGYCTGRLPEDQVCGCFAWEFSPAPGVASIHIANACLPESPFASLPDRRRELETMLARLRGVEPPIERIQCNSWLNGFPPFLRLFPDTWATPKRVGSVGPGGDWWGQFVARDGSFHQRHGEQLRNTGRFPWPSLYGCCRLEELAVHLEGRRL